MMSLATEFVLMATLAGNFWSNADQAADTYCTGSQTYTFTLSCLILSLTAEFICLVDGSWESKARAVSSITDLQRE